MSTPRQKISLPEFITLVAFVTALVALATDIMLPALGYIGDSLNVANPNHTQFVISAFFLGLAMGQVVSGPLSDRFGRKPVIYVGYGIFLLGTVVSMLTTHWEILLASRVLQGLGASAPRIAIMALVRDLYEGRGMARIMSIVSAIFIIVPVIAPALGQVVLAMAGWRAIFAVLAVLALSSVLWLGFRQPETLPLDRRRPFSVAVLWAGFKEILRTPATMGYTLCAGLIFGVFMGYLSSAQQVFQTTFLVGDWFAAYFAIAAISIGLASYLNSRLVMDMGMRPLTRRALLCIIGFALAFLPVVVMTGGVPPLWAFMIWLLATFFCLGILFGNLNALAMEPMGHMAGLGAAFVGSLSTLMSLPIGLAVGQFYDGTVYALVIGFGLCGLGAFVVMQATTKLR